MSDRFRQFFSRSFPLLTAVLCVACSGGTDRSPPVDDTPAGTPRTWIIPTDFVANGGPGKDGIPALTNPQFEPAATIDTVAPEDLVLAVRSGGQVKVYPEDIMDWHEVVNEIDEASPFVLSYCPLTASAVVWPADPTDVDPTFGVSGLLFNNNLILYDRETDSYWGQMLQFAISGPRSREVPDNIPVIETTFESLMSMYPDAVVMTRETGHSRNYDRYPYGTYRENPDTIFAVERLDNRLHPKERAVGIHNRTDAKVYQLDGFGSTTQTINDHFDGQPIVVVGNSAQSYAMIYSRVLSDGTILNFEPIQDDLPNVMRDTEGNVWDIFGTAVSGPRAGAQLDLARSYPAMWFAWAAHFENVQIHFD